MGLGLFEDHEIPACRPTDHDRLTPLSSLKEANILEHAAVSGDRDADYVISYGVGGIPKAPPEEVREVADDPTEEHICQSIPVQVGLQVV